jgi:ABC-type uncharacterized transport system ATPase subunit
MHEGGVHRRQRGIGHTARSDRSGILLRGRIRKLAESWIASFKIKAGSPDVKAGQLSGGNLQSPASLRPKKRRKRESAC